MKGGVILIAFLVWSCFAQPTVVDPTNEFYVEQITNSTLMPSIGNGYVATFIGSSSVYIGGLFNGFLSITPSHRASVPSPINYELALGPSQQGSLQSAGYLLNLTQATFSQYTNVLGTSGNKLAGVEQMWYAHQTYRSLLVFELIVDNSNNPSSLTLQLAHPVSSESSDITFKQVRLENTQVLLFNGTINQPEAVDGQRVVVAFCTTNSSTLTLNIPAGQQERYYFLSTFRTDIYGDSQFPANDALNDFYTYSVMESSLLNSHRASWKNIWDNVGIEFQGSGDILRLQQVTNSSLYWILSSARSDWPWGLSPGSLASNGYNGHSFWDTETWMYPSILMLDSPLAQALLQYRMNHRAGATRKAKTYDPPYKGTMFPWEDGFSGMEVCPFGVATCRLEQHISGDIAFAVKQYWSATHDLEWLASTGFPLAYEISEFWASRVKLVGNNYVIDDVIPPDEYAVGVNNSVYTNVVASFGFNFTKYAGDLLGIEVPASWSTIASNLELPFDSTRQIYLEYDGYTDDEIKQADVILLGFPLMYNMSYQIRENDLNFYSGVTDPNGPAMTWSMTAIGYLELEQYSTAQSYFEEGFANAQAPFQVWTETPTGGTVNFITGCGGFLQSLVFGYPSMRLHEDFILFLNPSLPTNVTSIKLRMVDYMGSQLNIESGNGSLTFALVDINMSAPLYVSIVSSPSVLRPSRSSLLESASDVIPLTLNAPTSVQVSSDQAVVLFTK